MATKKKTVKDNQQKFGWHFLPKSMVLGYGDGRKAVVGKTLKMLESGKPECCHQGMHASEKISQAALFKKGFVLCRVVVTGGISSEHDKFCGYARTVIWAKEITQKDFNALNNALNGDYEFETYGLMYASQNQPAKFDAFFESWAKKNGWVNDVAGKCQTVVINYEKKFLKAAEVKKFLSERVVRTYDEIYADMRHAYDVDGDSFGAVDLEDTLFSMVNNSIICPIEDYTKIGDTAYVIKPRKR
jgi:hypothetical protein